MVEYLNIDEMRISNNYRTIRILLIFVSSLFFAPLLKAQFTITENFKGSTVASNIVMGGNPNPATLTSGVVDPINQGWLRLTTDQTDQRGFAYINTSFPSTLGVYIEFEYKTWRSKSDTYNGADGFSVFLFDATTNFSIGGFGGSLGYAQRNAETGLAGAYLGIGFDEYGNFGMNSEGKNGGESSLQPNSIVLRGTANPAPPLKSYRYLTHKKLGAVAADNGITSIDYNTITTIRPADNIFFRRVKVYIEPIGTQSVPKYRIRVLWRTSPSGADTQLISYETTDPIPSMLKMGFGSSTGGGFNYHEIRNLLITTTGGVRVHKEVDKVSALPNENLTYTITVYNETVAAVSNLILNDNLKDQDGNMISLTNDFEISSITFNNNGKTGSAASGYTNGTPKTTGFSNPFSTTMTLEANSSATFTIVGIVKNNMAGKVLNNSVGLDVSGIGFTDPDLTNNFSTVSTTILNPNVDLKIEKGVNNNGIAQLSGNTYTIVVSNVSSINKPATDASKQVTVTDVIPAGLTVASFTAPGWTRSGTGNNFTFTRRDALNAQFAYPPITIKVTPTSGGGPWTNTTELKYPDDTNPNNNNSSVDLRWVNYWHGTIDTDWAKTGNWTANYVPISGQDIEFATALNNGPSGDGNGLGAAVNDLHLDTDRIIGDLINDSDKDLIVTTKNQLTINGDVKDNNLTKGTIVVQAKNDEAMGTLFFADPIKNTSVGATVQFYNKACECVNCGFFRKQWQYFGIPVKSASFPYNDVAGNETVNMWDETYNGDKWRSTSGALLSFKGYQINNSSTNIPTDVYNFPGQLNVGNANVALSKTDNVNYSGTNLVSNSFTAAIPISTGAMTFPLGVEQAVYMFNTGTRDQWRKLNGTSINQAGYRSGQYLAVPINLGGQLNFPDRIPSTHAFMVIKSTTGSGILGIDYSKLIKNTKVKLGDGATEIVTRSAKGSNEVEAGEATNTTQQLLPSLTIDVIGKESADRVWIFQKQGTTYNFDNGWDGRKMLEGGIAQLYVNAKDDSKLQVATVPELNGVTLGFIPDIDGKYILDFSLSGQLKGVDIYLHDAVTNTTQHVGDGRSYSFEAKKGESANRFSLTYTNKNRFLSDDEAAIGVTATNDRKIVIVNGSNKDCSVFVSDSNGTFLESVEVKSQGKSIMNNFAKGTYMVRLQNSDVNDVRRVVVK